MIAGGLVLLTVVADKLFGFKVTRREWIGVGLTAAGLAFLAATLEGEGKDAHADYESATLTIYAGLAFALAVALAWAGPRDAPRRRAARRFGRPPVGRLGRVDQGAQRQPGGGRRAGADTPAGAGDPAGSLAGLTVSARSLQLGKAVPVIAVTSAAANIWTISAGPIVFGEPLPDEPLALTVRLLAFALVIFAAALTPAPVRAAGVEPA